MVASVAGVVALAASTARTLISLIQDMADAPEEILHIRRDVQSLSAVLGSVQDISVRYDLKSEELALVSSLTEYLSLCQDSMQSIRVLLAPLAEKGGGRKSPLRMIGWVMRKSEIKALRERLQESKASLNITISALNGVLEGKGQDEIRKDVNKIYEKLVIEFRNRNTGRRVRRRMEDDVASVSARGGRRQSISESTDVAFTLERYFDELPETPLRRQGSNLQEPDESEILPHPFSAEPTALLDVVRARDKDGVVRLISRGCSIAERTQNGQTALHFCAIYNDSEMAQILLEHGADINARDNQLRSPLNVALSSEAMSVAILLVQRGCSLTGCADMIFPLTQRIEEISGIGILLKDLAPKLNKSTKGPYIVHQAVESNDLQSLDLLLSAGFDPNQRNTYGLPPLYEAMLQNQKQAVRLLLNYGANKDEYLPLETRDKLSNNNSSHQRLADKLLSGITPLAVAARVLRDVEMTRILLDSGADPNFIYPNNGVVMLNGLGDEEYLECAKIIIESGANVNIRDFTGTSPVYWANACNNPKLMDFMLGHGGEANHYYDDEHPTILFLAAARGHKEIAEILLKHGADLTVKNNSGKTALDIARNGHHEVITTILESAGAKGGSA